MAAPGKRFPTSYRRKPDRSSDNPISTRGASGTRITNDAFQPCAPATGPVEDDWRRPSLRTFSLVVLTARRERVTPGPAQEHGTVCNTRFRGSPDGRRIAPGARRGERYPLMTPIGRRRATFFESPA